MKTRNILLINLHKAFLAVIIFMLTALNRRVPKVIIQDYKKKNEEEGILLDMPKDKKH